MGILLPFMKYLNTLGSKKTEGVPGGRPAAAPWCGGFQGGERRAAGRPEPLWRPTAEEEEEDNEPGPSSDVPELSVSQPVRESPRPASPRTLKAIQAAMADSSDKEEEEPIGKGGGASPRTLLAIQQALAEEEDHFLEPAVVSSDSPPETQMSRDGPAPRAVLSSSDEEAESDPGKSGPQDSLNLNRNKTNPSSHMKDGLLASSSEDEVEEVIGRRSGDLQQLRATPEGGVESKDGSDRGQLSEDTRQGRMEQQPEPQGKVSLSGPTRAQPQDADAVTLERRSPTGAPGKTGNSEASEESDSEGSGLF